MGIVLQIKTKRGGEEKEKERGRGGGRVLRISYTEKKVSWEKRTLFKHLIGLLQYALHASALKTTWKLQQLQNALIML